MENVIWSLKGIRTWYNLIFICSIPLACGSESYDLMGRVQGFVTAQNESDYKLMKFILAPELDYPPYSSKKEFADGLKVSRFLHQKITILNIRQEGNQVISQESFETDLSRMYGFEENPVKEMTYSFEDGKISGVKFKVMTPKYYQKEKALWKRLYEKYPRKAPELREKIKAQRPFLEDLQTLIKDL